MVEIESVHVVSVRRRSRADSRVGDRCTAEAERLAIKCHTGASQQEPDMGEAVRVATARMAGDPIVLGQRGRVMVMLRSGNS